MWDTYLKNSHAWNKNARAKLHIHEAKLCNCPAWFLMHQSSHGIKERSVDDGVIALLLGCSFAFLQNVSGQQIF